MLDDLVTGKTMRFLDKQLIFIGSLDGTRAKGICKARDMKDGKKA